MKKLKLLILTPAHNEEKVISRCLYSVKRLQMPQNIEATHIVILDRCSDRTEQICKDLGVQTLKKEKRGDFVDARGEVVDFALKRLQADLILNVDADIQLKEDTLLELLPHIKNNVVCVSSMVRSRTDNAWLNLLMWLRDLSYLIAPLGRKIYGACLLFRYDVVEKIGGFGPTVPRWETGFEMKLNEHKYETKVVNVTVIEQRPTSVKAIVARQISDGQARRKMKTGFLRTVGHALFRGRPFVIWGYILERKGVE